MTFFPSDDDAAYFEHERQTLQDQRVARAQIQQAADIKRMADEVAQLRSLVAKQEERLAAAEKSAGRSQLWLGVLSLLFAAVSAVVALLGYLLSVAGG